MTGVPYPVVIAAIKEWIGGHKTMPSQSMEIDGQPAIKKASFADMCTMAFTELVSLAVTAGVSIVAGGSAGFDKFVDGLNPALKEPLAGLKDAVGKITDLVPGGTSFIDTIKETFINPIGESLDMFKAGFNGAESQLRAAAANLAGSGNDDLIAEFTNAADAFKNSTAGQIGGVIGKAVDDMKSWSDNLSIGGVTDLDPLSPTYNQFIPSNFKLTDAFNYVNNSSATLLSALRITDGPTLTDLVGTVVQKDLTTTLQSKIVKEQVARQAVIDDIAEKIAANPPVDDGNGGTTTTPFEVDPDKKAAWAAAQAEVVAAAAAVQARVDADKANVAMMLGQQTAVAAVGSAISEHGSISDPDMLSLYEETLHPNVKAAVTQLSPMAMAAMSTNVAVSNLDTGKTPGTYD